MKDFFKDRKKFGIAAGLICLAVIFGIFYINGLIRKSFSSRMGAAPESKTARDIDSAVSLAIKSRNTGYAAGETSAEGHIILGTEESNHKVKVYIISSFGVYGFEDGIFTKISGSGAGAAVMIFSKSPNGEYTLLEFKEPQEGERSRQSITKMFPVRVRDKALSAQKYYPVLEKQEEAQALEYLKSIRRNAEVRASYVGKHPVNINSRALNKLFIEMTKYDDFLNRCPNWIGTREYVEGGVRYIYKTSQSKTSDGCDLITFSKTKEDETVVEERKYKILDGDPELISQFKA